MRERYRYTSNSVFNSFPWPQDANEKQIEKIAKYAKQLREKRREIMQQYNYSLRDLYRIMEDSPDNPVSDIQDKLDQSVLNAYGIGKNDDILAFLLDLNNRVFEKEKRKLPVVSPGLPDFIDDHSQYMTTDCIEM